MRAASLWGLGQKLSAQTNLVVCPSFFWPSLLFIVPPYECPVHTYIPVAVAEAEKEDWTISRYSNTHDVKFVLRSRITRAQNVKKRPLAYKNI